MSSIKEQHVPSYSDKQKQYDRIDEIEALRMERLRLHDTIRRNNAMRDKLYVSNRYGISFSPVASFIIYWIIELLVILFTVFYIVQDPGAPLIFVLILVSIIILIAVLNLLVVYPKIIKMRKIDSDNKELYAESRILDDKLKALEHEDN